MVWCHEQMVVFIRQEVIIRPLSSSTYSGQTGEHSEVAGYHPNLKRKDVLDTRVDISFALETE